MGKNNDDKNTGDTYVTVSISRATNKRAAVYAAANDLTKSQVFEQALNAFFKHTRQKQDKLEPLREVIAE